MAWTDIALVAATPVIKNFAGWIMVSLEDYSYEAYGLKFWKAIQPYEIDKLIKSLPRSLLIAITLALGLDIGTGQEMSLAVFIDVMVGQLKKGGSKK